MSEDDLPRLAVYIPIRAFKRVPADVITNCVNELIVDINAALESVGLSPGVFVTMKQLRMAMKSQGILLGFDQSVNAIPTDTINILWNHGNTMVVGDALYLSIETQTGYTTAQMTALVALAQTFAP